MSKLVEEWKDIEGYEGLYQVSDWGNVRNRHGKLIAKELSNGGYYRVHLWKNGVSEHLLIHRLVAEAFIPNPENKPCVGHLKPLPDGTEDKTANEVWYLQWMTYPENANYGTINERRSNSQKGREFTEEHKKNISESLKNSEIFQKMVHSDEYKQKLRNAQKYHPQLNREDLSEPVLQFSLDGTFVAEYPSAKQAARHLNVGQCNISRCCNGGFFYKGKWINVSKAYGFIWKKAADQQASQPS